ncbi:CBS domain-containing protein [Candidatus Woesearchaeota archaeon]|nr:CBS domain-containing protein [Candidatus Woesearchaeota archaeon]
MIAEISEIKILRKRHGLTQTQLAKLSGVSQSLIAKLEAGIIDPSYSNVKKITETLSGLREKTEPKAENAMSDKIISVTGESLLSEAIKKMKHYEISQMPVIEGGVVAGLIAETDVIESIHTGKDIKQMKVKDAMAEAPPTVPLKTPLKAVTELLRISPIVVVTDKGKPKGAITKADILNKLSA